MKKDACDEFDIYRERTVYANNRVGFYGERGLMTWLFNYAIPQRPWWFADKVEMANGESLAHILNVHSEADICRVTSLNEFDLGKSGFGCPDGAVIVENRSGMKSWVFVEAKNESYEKSSMDWKVAESRRSAYDRKKEAADGDLTGRIEKNYGYNSSINGQLELKWRFVKALHATEWLNRGEIGNNLLIIEGQTLATEYSPVDAFYWDKPSVPAASRVSCYRRLRVSGGIKDICKAHWRNISEENFYFIAITLESKSSPTSAGEKLNPFRRDMSKPNLHMPKMLARDSGENERKRFGWLNMEVVKTEMEKLEMTATEATAT